MDRSHTCVDLGVATFGIMTVIGVVFVRSFICGALTIKNGQLLLSLKWHTVCSDLSV